MFVFAIARVAHNVNRAYCLSIGDTSQPEWKDVPEWQRSSIIAGVEFTLANLDATPEESHASWMLFKAADGWVYGETKDPERKTHPAFLPYDQLPQEQRVKDYLFQAVVRSLSTITDAAAAADNQERTA